MGVRVGRNCHVTTVSTLSVRILGWYGLAGVFFGQTHTLLLVWRHRYNTWQLRCVQCACSPLQILSQNLTRFITTSQPPGCPCFFLQWSYLETASQAKNTLFIWKWTVNDVIFSEENYGLRFAAFVSDPSNSVLQCWLLNDVITLSLKIAYFPLFSNINMR